MPARPAAENDVAYSYERPDLKALADLEQLLQHLDRGAGAAGAGAR